MGLNARRAVRAACGACALASVVPLAACESTVDTTGVRLTIRYVAPPARLRVGARSESGEQFGPQLLPDRPRRLSPSEESVLLRLSADLGGERLVLWAEGLDEDAAVRARGTQDVRVIAGAIVDRVVHLSPALGCAPGSTAADCAPVTTDPADGGVRPGSTVRARDAAPAAGASSAGSAGAAPAAGSAAPETAGSQSTPAVPGMPAASDAGSPPQTSPPPPPDASTPPPDASMPPPDAGVVAGCQTGCDEDGGVAGCACAFDCRKSKNICAPACSAGSTCDVACTEGEHCGISCVDSLCSLDCQRSKECRASCTGSSDCTIKCQRGEDCRAMRCDGNARCLLECKDAKNCAFASCPTGAVTCPGGRLACNRPCPP